MESYGLIGFPLGHSFSRQYFEEKFKNLGLTGFQYELFPMQQLSELPSLIHHRQDLKGFNVTIPHKENILSLLDRIDPEAKKTGAVNTVRIERNGDKFRLTGYNTDTYGFELAIRPLLSNEHTKALVLGSGGASKAVIFALQRLGIAVSVVSRNKNNGYIYSELSPQVIKSHTLIINTTPLGMYPDTTTLPPIPYDQLTSGHLLYDLVYNPQETAFMKAGKLQGASVEGGLKMLELQADKAWEIWRS